GGGLLVRLGRPAMVRPDRLTLLRLVAFYMHGFWAAVWRGFLLGEDVRSSEHGTHESDAEESFQKAHSTLLSVGGIISFQRESARQRDCYEWSVWVVNHTAGRIEGFANTCFFIR